MIDGNPIETHSKDGMQLWVTLHHQCCQLKDLKATYVLNRENIDMILKLHKTNFVQILPRTEARLVAERKDAVNWHTRSVRGRNSGIQLLQIQFLTL